MADLAASIAKARKAGYSDAEIAAYIAKDPKFGPKVQTARKAGYKDVEIVRHLGKVNGAMDVLKSTASGLMDGVSGLADTVLQASPMGFADATLKTAAGVAQTLGGKPQTRMANPFSATSQQAKRQSYTPQTTAGEFGRTVGQNIPNALAPGSAGARIANVFAPAIASETAGQIARVSGAGPTGEAVARGVGALGGAGMASVRPQNIFASRPSQTPIDRFATRARPDPAAMQARAQEMRAAGVRPSLVDVSGERGRRMIRAVGVKGEEAGEALTENAARISATTKPAAMASTRRLNSDPRTAAQYADETEAARSVEATQNYSQFDAKPIEVPETVVDMLSDGPGRSIISRARNDAAEAQDWARQVDLDRLLQHKPGDPLPRVSAGTLDKLSAAARDRGVAFAAKPGGRTRAAGTFSRREQIDATLEGVPELQPTRQAFAEKSRAIEIARDKGRLDPFSTDPADYANWLSGLPAEAQQANQIALRQEILDTLGGQRSGGSLGTLDDLATSPYAQANLRATFGPAADSYIAEITARLAQTRNAAFVNPNAGSRTAVLQEDTGNQAQQAVGALRQVASGDVLGLAARATDAWRRRGISPQQAEELARIAIDPNQTDAAIQAIAARLAPQQRGEFLQLRNAVAVGATGLATGGAQSTNEPRP